jgi:hypothetical protein
LKFDPPKTYQISEHLNKLAQPKPPFHSRDFFLNKDFRGLFLADHQEAIGEKAFKCVDELNKTVLTKFKGLKGFNEDLAKRKEMSTYYKEELIPRIKMEKSQLQQGSRIKTSHSNQRGATSFSVKSVGGNGSITPNMGGGEILVPISERSQSVISRVTSKFPINENTSNEK